jgi:hypothetical protein
MAYAVINHIKKIKIHYLSDIHLEFLKKIPNIKKLANNIILSCICMSNNYNKNYDKNIIKSIDKFYMCWPWGYDN